MQSFATDLVNARMISSFSFHGLGLCLSVVPSRQWQQGWYYGCSAIGLDGGCIYDSSD